MGFPRYSLVAFPLFITLATLLEIRHDLVDWVNAKARSIGAPVVAVFCHAQKHLDRIFAVPLLSLFVIDGEYSGAFARVLPAGEGHVMSPPPPGMGFTLVYDC